MRQGGEPVPAVEPITFEIRLEDDESMAIDAYATLDISPDGDYIIWSTTGGIRAGPTFRHAR